MTAPFRGAHAFDRKSQESRDLAADNFQFNEKKIPSVVLSEAKDLMALRMARR